MFQGRGGRACPVLWERLSSDTGEWEMAHGSILHGCIPAGHLCGMPGSDCLHSGECEGEESEAVQPCLFTL